MPWIVMTLEHFSYNSFDEIYLNSLKVRSRMKCQFCFSNKKKNTTAIWKAIGIYLLQAARYHDYFLVYLMTPSTMTSILELPTRKKIKHTVRHCNLQIFKNKHVELVPTLLSSFRRFFREDRDFWAELLHFAWRDKRQQKIFFSNLWIVVSVYFCLDLGNNHYLHVQKMRIEYSRRQLKI